MGHRRVTALVAASALVWGTVSGPSYATPARDHINISISGSESHDRGHWEPAPRVQPRPLPVAPLMHARGNFRARMGVPTAGVTHIYVATPVSPGPWRHQWGDDDGDIRHFHDHDWDDWHHGHWIHNWYGGVFGWWFVVSNVWFWYPVPVYPYPDPYVPATFVAPPPPEDEAPEDAAPATTQFWYYCPASNGYYPYVPTCPTGWQQVPATPDQAAPPAGTTAPPSSDDEGGDAG